jgi:hypothetical protein
MPDTLKTPRHRVPNGAPCRVTVSMSNDLYALVKKRAATEKRSHSAIISMLLSKMLQPRCRHAEM